MPANIAIPAWYYQQFDADPNMPVPAQAYGGWKKRGDMPFSMEHSALVVMHAWYTGKPGEYPGWERAVEYIPRANRILDTFFPALLSAARKAALPVFHVVGGGQYFAHLPEYQESAAMAGEEPSIPKMPSDPVLDGYRAFRFSHSHPGAHNQPDIARGVPGRDFAPQAKPAAGEPIVATANQLFARCRQFSVNHLVYSGFAINWCLQMSPCCMLDMSRHGIFCSAIREATTAVENRESAQGQLAKQLELWKIALAFGFIYDLADFVAALCPEQPFLK